MNQLIALIQEGLRPKKLKISKFVQAKFFQKSEYPLFFGISRNCLGKVIKRKEKDFLPTPQSLKVS